MRKLCIPLVAMMTAMPAIANPMFGPDHRNAVTVYAGQSTGPGSLFKLVDPILWDITPMTMAMIQYSQPMTIFRLPARQNLAMVQNTAYHSSTGLSFFGVGISWDVALIDWRGFYAGIGLGPYMRDSHDRYVQSRLVFGEKVFFGYQMCDGLRAEFFTLHFSNGDFTEVNRGFNFTGLGISVSF